MKSIRHILALTIVLALAACSLPSRSTPQPTQALDISLVGTIAAATLQAMATSTFTPAPTSEPSSTPTLTSTITPTNGPVTLKFNGNTNCRKGPGENYDVVTVLKTGLEVQAIGRVDKTNYWLVKRSESAETCWASADFAQMTGNAQALPTVTAPPTSTPKPPNAPAWASWNYNCDFASGGNNITMNLVWTDRSSNETGFIVYRDGQPIANLGPDTASYTETIFVATGQSVSYKVEVKNESGTASTSTVSAACQ
jgi:uncharacterized protein YgiM (DUF1202 family)